MKRREWKRQTNQRKRKNFPSPASSQQRQGEAAASKKRTVVQHLLEERAQHPSLLVEHRHQPAAAPAAPTRKSLVLPKPAAAMACTAAIDCTNFNAKAASNKMSNLASEQLSGDSFMTSFSQGGMLRHKLAHLELTVAALAQGERACSTLA